MSSIRMMIMNTTIMIIMMMSPATMTIMTMVIMLVTAMTIMAMATIPPDEAATARTRRNSFRQGLSVYSGSYCLDKAKRGKSYRSDARLNLPVYLDEGVRDYLANKAKSKNVEVNGIVNDLTRTDIEMIEGVK